MLRILYRLRTLSEQAPFDAATFSFAYFLLARVARKGGVGVSKEGEEGEDEALEQVALVLDIIKFHRSECTSRSTLVCGVLTLTSFRCCVSAQGGAPGNVACREDAAEAEQGRIIAAH